jgi:hypothetical protein
MKPLKITAWLDAPLAGEIPMLDSIVEWSMSLHLDSICPGVKRAGPDEPVEPGTIPIPIRRRRVGRFPVPLCSAGITPAPIIDTHEHFHMSMAGIRATETCDRRVLSVKSGQHRSYRLPLRVRVVDRVCWYVVGRAKDLRRWLRGVPAVGKKTAYGYGLVARWEVEPAGEDWSWFAPSPAGPVLMRPLPAEVDLPDGLIGYRRWFGSPVPPYWQRNLYTEIVQPC